MVQAPRFLSWKPKIELPRRRLRERRSCTEGTIESMCGWMWQVSRRMVSSEGLAKHMLRALERLTDWWLGVEIERRCHGGGE